MVICKSTQGRQLARGGVTYVYVFVKAYVKPDPCGAILQFFAAKVQATVIFGARWSCSRFFSIPPLLGTDLSKKPRSSV